MQRQPIINFISFLLIFLFVYTAISKLMDIHAFEALLKAMPGIQSYAGFIAFAIPVAELMTAILLLLPGTRETGFLCSAFLLLCFTLFLLYMLVTASQLPCSCGGVISSMNWQQHIGFNLFFIVLSVLAFYYQHTGKNMTINQTSLLQ
ncbi:hypothetical protein BH10BAC2_BH10BAC2_18070 [soil metagenome]